MKPVEWIGSRYRDFRAFPDPVQDTMGFALCLARVGQRHGSSKPLKGLGGAGVLEIVEDHQGDTWRAVYTVRFDNAVYVSHVFQEKARKGIKTPQEEIEGVRRRLRIAEQEHEARGRGVS